MRMAGRILVLFISSISLFVEGYRVVREANSALAVEDPTNKTNETDPADFELPETCLTFWWSVSIGMSGMWPCLFYQD